MFNVHLPLLYRLERYHLLPALTSRIKQWLQTICHSTTITDMNLELLEIEAMPILLKIEDTSTN